jgi:hypothetical protein
MKGLLEFFTYLLQILNIEAGNNNEPEGKEEDLDEDAKPKDVYAWLLKKMKDDKAKDVSKNNSPFFIPGKIYVFKYKPFHKDKYPFWDEHPIVLALGKMPAAQGEMNVGLNLSWYPPAARKYIMDQVKKMYDKPMKESIKKKAGDAIGQPGIPLDVYRLKLNLDQYGLSWAIRNYLPGQIESPAYVISYEHWDKMSKLDIPQIFPEIKGDGKLFDIYKNYEDYVLKCRTNKGAMMKRTEQSMKKGRFKFLK